MESKHFCRDRGTLVTRDAWLPEDPRDYSADGLVAFIGCNRLVCDACHEAVRSALGFAQAPSLATLKATADWTQLPEHDPHGSFRVYACACTVKLVTSPTALEADSRDDFGGSDLPPWACAGHPPLAPGDEVDGLRWTGDIAALAAPALAAKVALHPRVDGMPGFEAHRIDAMLPDRPARDAFSRAIADLVDDGSLRPAVALFFGGHPRAAGIGEVARHATAHPEHFQGVPAGWGPKETLDHYLGDGLATSLTLTPSGAESALVREAYRTFATHSPGLGASVLRLARVDPEFVQDELGAIIMANPPSWRAVLTTARPTHVGPIINAGIGLVKAGVAKRDDVLLALRDVSPPAVVSDVARMWPPDPS